jgi:hypothetical protein
MRGVLRDQCPVGLAGHYKAEKIFADLKMSARLYLRARAHRVVRRGNCVSTDTSGLCFSANHLRTSERRKSGTQ